MVLLGLGQGLLEDADLVWRLRTASFGLEEADHLPETLELGPFGDLQPFGLGVHDDVDALRGNETRGLSCRVDGAEATWSREDAIAATASRSRPRRTLRDARRRS